MTSKQLKDAETYPKFCPECGQHRQVKLVTEAFANKITFIGQNPPAVQQRWEHIPYCTRCGFKWKHLPDPGRAFYTKLQSLSDPELMKIIRAFNPIFKMFIKPVAERSKLSQSYAQRVLEGTKKNQAIEIEFVREFRRRLENSELSTII
jgi:hypothetical protein